jgi:ATP-dependent exoDNAse (exonuclease V) beta subunit
LPFLQDALDAGGLPYRAEASSLVYATRAVRDLLMVLRAVSDPTNELHVVSALRSPLLACGDDELFRFRVQGGGHWQYLDDQPESVAPDDPVGLGLAYLRHLHHESRWRTPSELLDLVARDRRALELGFAEGRPRDVWRRLRFVIDQARAWSDATHGGLRQYLRWVELQSAEGARVAEAVLPESDDDAVRIMTIHAAKGLEFPITVLSGMSTRPMSRPAAAQAVFPPGGGVGYRVGKAVQTEEYEAWKPIDEQMAADERVRLLYVACTRARDHLIVSLHRPQRSSPAERKDHSNAELLVAGMGAALDGVPDAVELGSVDEVDEAGRPAARGLGLLAVVPPGPVLTLAQWAAERDLAIGRAERPSAIAATALADDGSPDHGTDEEAGLQKRPRDQDLPPWLKGRYGTAVGRAVHGTLQTIDLATGAGIDSGVAAQCEAEAIPGRAADVRALVASALGAPSVQEAARSPHWREVYACTPVGDRLLEGYVDLLYRGPDGLVVVDYKTASVTDPAELDGRLHAYRLQGGSYALAVAQATGEPVVRVTFLFLTPAGPVERHLADLPAIAEEIRALVDAGKEVVVDEAG